MRLCIYEVILSVINVVFNICFFFIVLDYNSFIFCYSRFILKYDLGVIGYLVFYKGVFVVGLILILEVFVFSDLGDSGVRIIKLNY